MGRFAPSGSDIAGLVFETCTDALETGILVFSKSDILVAVSRNIGNFFPVSSEVLQPGVSLRSFLVALFAAAPANEHTGSTRSGASRDEWVSERIAAMWHERGETVVKMGRERWLSVTTRRLAGGLGIMMVQDVSAHRKMEERWRADMERVAVTEDILDNLPSMLFVLDRNLHYVAVNKAYRRFLGLQPENILDRPVEEFLDQDAAMRWESQARMVLQTGKAVAEFDELQVDGAPTRILKQYFRLGTPGHYFVVAHLQTVERLSSDLPDAADEPHSMSSLGEELELADLHSAPLVEHAPSHSNSVIVLSGDDTFGSALSEALRAFRFDACHTSSIEEARAIISVASEAGLTVDLIMADDQGFDAAGLRGLGVKLLPVSRARPVHFAVAEAAAAVTSNAMSRPHAQDTDYLPDFPMPSHIPDPSGLGVEILVVEDNVINQEVYSQILGGLGISFELARDGEEALRLWDVLRPPLVLMDVDLPVMSGLEATRKIRAAEAEGGQRATIVGVMPHPSQERHDQCLAAGMDQTIFKPLAVETIEGVYRRHVVSNPHDAVDFAFAGHVDGAAI